MKRSAAPLLCPPIGRRVVRGPLPLTVLICPVRGCRASLRREARSLVCPRGHTFDVARSGYCNLLQPQDRRSPQAGDSKEAAEARRRLFDAGFSAPLLRELSSQMAALVLPERPSVLDVGCGEGSMLGTLSREPAPESFEAHGVDLSIPSIDLAARRYHEATWIVANADRFLPYEDGSFDVVMLLTARLNPPELRRVISPAGRLLVAVPGPDDLAELREALLGERILRDRLERAAEELGESFELESRRTVRHTERLTPASLRDLLASSYRGARESERRRLGDLKEMDVTLSRELGCFRPR